MTDDNISIPQDFLDIDADESHWVMTGVSGPNEGRRFPDKNLFCVPDTGALSDMTDAMMSEIPGMDDIVQAKKLEERRWYKFCMAYLMQDGNLGVPGGRYGRNTRDCAEIAIIMTLVMQHHIGEPITYYSLNSDMSMVVNGADGVATTLSESQYIIDDSDFADQGISVKELLGDEYEPQTPLERIAKHFEIALEGSGDNVSLTLTMDDDDAEKLIEAIKDNEGAFYDRQA